MGIKLSKGNFLIIWITGDHNKYIAEITQEEPLKMKVTEHGPFAFLQDGDFIILKHDTLQFQKSTEDAMELIKEWSEKGKPLLSGLHNMNVTDGELHTILPG